MKNNGTSFTWIQTHKELAQYLKGKEDEQHELVELLREAGVTQGLVDEHPEGNRYDLEEIDPFSFFCFIYKYGTKKRLEVLQRLAEKLNLHYPEDEFGIPSAQAQKVMMFPFKFQRNDDEIKRLWEFFYSVLNDNVSEQQFEDTLNIYGVGIVKITEALFYVAPKTYLPINGPTKPYLEEVLSINPKFSTWEEYLDILNEVKKKTNTPFYELSYDAWVWNEEQKETNYWLSQGNPKMFDLERSLKDEALSSWRVNAHKNKIKPGDKVILWSSGDRRGCYALCEVDSEVREDFSSKTELPYYKNGMSKEKFDKVDLKISHNLVTNPITYDQIKRTPTLTDLNIGNQGTNFSATKEQFEAILDIAKVKLSEKHYWLYSPGPNANKWSEFYEDGTMRLGWEDLGDLSNYQTKEEIVKKLQDLLNTDSSKKNDATANWDFANEINIGDIVIAKKGRGEYIGYGIVTSDYFYDESLNEFKSTRKVDWIKKGSWDEPKGDNVVKTLTDITSYPDYVARIKNIIGLEDHKIPIKEIDYPLNTIFYGPPGTGKTYNTIKRAAEIVERREIKTYSEAQKIFKNQLGDTIEFITFHQNYSYEDFIQGLRPDIENEKELTFERVDGIFKKIADRAVKNYQDSKKPKAKKQAFEAVFNQFIQPLVEGEVEEIEIEMKRVSFYITSVTTRSIEFRKASGGTAHTLSINTLKKMYEAESVLEIQGLSSYYSPLLDKLIDIGKSDSQTEIVERKNYVIIIDEINRANISRVFGELITLIEPDKRYGRELHIPAKLPSGEMFKVPSNLYVIGTMNTADKSISLLDIALRRRFEFEAMYPQYEIDGEEITDADILRKINTRIQKLKGHDFQIGHSYFMGNGISLIERMNRRVIPLLLEYFMNDDKEVTEILAHAGLKVEEGAWPIRITGKL